MNAGLPGTGIGGLFYLASALWMPFDALWRRISGRTHRVPVRLLLRQSTIAAGILGALWVTGWAIGFLIAWVGSTPALGGMGVAGREVSSVIHWSLLVGSVTLLVIVLVTVEILRLALPRVVPSPLMSAIAGTAAEEPTGDGYAASAVDEPRIPVAVG